MTDPAQARRDRWEDLLEAIKAAIKTQLAREFGIDPLDAGVRASGNQARNHEPTLS